jgi:hypothetical protein
MLSGELKRVQQELEEVRRERTSLVEMNNDLSNQVLVPSSWVSANGCGSGSALVRIRSDPELFGQVGSEIFDPYQGIRF